MEDYYPSQLELEESEKYEYFTELQAQNEELRDQTTLLQEMLENQRRETMIWRGISILIALVPVGAQFV